MVLLEKLIFFYRESAKHQQIYLLNILSFLSEEQQTRAQIRLCMLLKYIYAVISFNVFRRIVI